MALLNFLGAMLPGLPGALMDPSAFEGGDIVTCTCASVIPFGIAVEYKADGTVQPVQQTGWPPAAPLAIAGIVIRNPFVEQALAAYAVPPTTAGSTFVGYPKGFRIPVLKRGRIWMAYDGGGTPPKFGVFNIWHSSTGASPQGVATLTATSASAGVEIGAAPAGLSVYNPGLLAKLYTDPWNQSVGIMGVQVNL